MNKLLFFIIFTVSVLAKSQEEATAPIVNPQEVNTGIQAIQEMPMLGERDPFEKPKYIQELEAEAAKAGVINPNENAEDSMVEAIRRYSLSDYSPVAIIWDVKNPKVMIADKNGTMHLLRRNYRIGNKEGIITAINEGEIVVTERGIPRVLGIRNATQNGGAGNGD